MSNNNNNQINIPQAREAMDKFKMQAAQEVGVNLQNGYNQCFHLWYRAQYARCA